jgi:Rrf2 family nitric oxide-sensitive transcriptional repressor
VVRALEPQDMAPCFDDPSACTITSGCGLRGALAGAQAAFLAELDAVTLAACVAEPRALVQLVGRAS